MRDPVEEDAAAFSAMLTPGISRWLARWPSPLPIEAALARVQAMRAGNAAGRGMGCTVANRTDNAVMGFVSVHRAAPGLGILGYWLGEDFRRQSYMPEAARALVAVAWEALRLDRIEAMAQIGNVGSFGVMRACGMRPVRDLVEYIAMRDRDELVRVFGVERP